MNIESTFSVACLLKPQSSASAAHSSICRPLQFKYLINQPKCHFATVRTDIKLQFEQVLLHDLRTIKLPGWV